MPGGCAADGLVEGCGSGVADALAGLLRLWRWEPRVRLMTFGLGRLPCMVLLSARGRCRSYACCWRWAGMWLLMWLAAVRGNAAGTRRASVGCLRTEELTRLRCNSLGEGLGVPGRGELQIVRHGTSCACLSGRSSPTA